MKRLGWPLAAMLLLGVSAYSAQPNKRPTDAQRGKELYERHCVQCHGAQGAGKGPATTALVQPVPDLRNKIRPTDETVRLVLKGKNSMPGFEASFDRHDARRVLQHMATLGKSKAKAPAKTGPAKAKAPGAPKPAPAPEQAPPVEAGE